MSSFLARSLGTSVLPVGPNSVTSSSVPALGAVAPVVSWLPAMGGSVTNPPVVPPLYLPPPPAYPGPPSNLNPPPPPLPVNLDSTSAIATTPITAVTMTPVIKTECPSPATRLAMPPPPARLLQSLPSPTPLPSPPPGHYRPCKTKIKAASGTLKRPSDVRLYKEICHRRRYSRDILPSGIESSESSSDDDEDLLPWQQSWYILATHSDKTI